MIYDRFASYYDRLFAPFEKKFLGRWRAEAFDELPAEAALLEIGAGTGANFEFYPPCRRAVASEISLSMLHAANAKRGLQQLVQADAQELPFADDSFDAAAGTLVFCSIPRPDAAFAELRRVVRPGGRIVLLEHVRPDNLLGYLFDLLSVFTVALIEDHFNRRTAHLAAAAGLKIIEVRSRAAGAVNLIVCENHKKAQIRKAARVDGFAVSR
jgi:ubiquinone/menaquinone biosynthesis C-methylase UbiE